MKPRDKRQEREAAVDIGPTEAGVRDRQKSHRIFVFSPIVEKVEDLLTLGFRQVHRRKLDQTINFVN